MIVIKEDFDIRNDCWSGAADRIDDLSEEQVDELEKGLEELFRGETPTETEVNDFIWFEDDTWAEWLGFESYDELLFCASHPGSVNFYRNGGDYSTDDMLSEEFEGLDEEVKEEYSDWEEWADDEGWELIDAIF